MPKVSSIRFEIQGKSIDFAIHYKKSEKFFIKDFPDEVLVIAEDFKRQGKKFETENELITYYSTLIVKFHEIISRTRKVIAYHLSAPDAFKDLTGLTKEIIDKIGYVGRDKNTFGFTIEYDILFEQTDNGKSFFNVNEDNTIGSKANFATHLSTIIDYTPERELFFINLNKRMQDIFLKVITIMADAQQFTALIDSGVKLLG